MSEDARISRNPGEPPKAGEPGAARWAAYLDWVREEIIGGVLAMSAAEQRTSRLPSGWTPVELLSHCLHMEQRWLIWGFLAEPVAEPFGDWDHPDPSAEEVTARWHVAQAVTADALADRLRAVGARTRAILATTPLETVAAVGGRFEADPPTLEWICFHVLAEYTRHAGHLDVVAELAEPRTRSRQA